MIIQSEYITYTASLFGSGFAFGIAFGLIVWFMAYCAVQVIYFFKTVTNG